MVLSRLYVFGVVVLLQCTLALATFKPSIVTPSSRAVVKMFKADGGEATMYAVTADGYDEPFYIVNVTAADHFVAGQALGYLSANQSVENFHALLNSLLPDKDAQVILEAFVDIQLAGYLLPSLPQKYQDEIAGVQSGANMAGIPEAYQCIIRGLALGSIAVGDLEADIKYLVEGELEGETPNVALRQAIQNMMQRGMTVGGIARHIASSRITTLGKTCSMFGTWGSRTEKGRLYTGRNLDWAADTGLSNNKVVMVYHIGDSIPHAAVGFAGLIGAITGISAKGVTVHEAGDDSKNVTLTGFAWMLRLRELMATATTLHDAQVFWNSTGNTMGMNHGIGSAADNRFMALETNAVFTAMFMDNDPREANRVVDGKRVGFPLQEAVWRTNHGYDPQFLSTAVSPKPGRDTLTRYMLLHDAFVDYANSSTLISDMQAVNLTAIVGDKGSETFLSCDNASKGENIISATFVPSVNGDSIMYLAFENGHSDKHVPACCNNYVKFNMGEYFNGST
eukprot:m.354045 g.354045  ORF g.354045 m.354045 type:complete len:509 (+) comp16908_c0_seq1:44-1570(+)